MATTYRVIGTRPIRPDGYGKVTGKNQDGADVRPPGMLHAKVLRSPHPHARIVRCGHAAVRRPFPASSPCAAPRTFLW